MTIKRLFIALAVVAGALAPAVALAASATAAPAAPAEWIFYGPFMSKAGCVAEGKQLVATGQANAYSCDPSQDLVWELMIFVD